MILAFTKKSQEAYQKLPSAIQKKADKQFHLLLVNFRHPSLRTRKMSGRDVFEARVDIRYRFTFQVLEKTIYVLTVGPHDTGLGKK